MIKLVELERPFEYPVLMQSNHNPGLVVLFFNAKTVVTIKNEDYPENVGKIINYSSSMEADNADMWWKFPEGTQIIFTQE